MDRPRARTAITAALALTAGLATGASGADETAPPGPHDSPAPIGVFSIEDMPWLLTAQRVDGAMTPVPEDVVVSLSMDDGRAGGNGGCNTYFASYQLDGFDVSFSEIGSTLMACAPPAGDVESAYLANLAMVASYQSGGIQMALLDGGGEFLLEFDLAPLTSVVGAWTAQGINDGDEAVVSSAMTSAVTADFSESGELTGSDGCNDYLTAYEIDGDRITIGADIESTERACRSDELTAQSEAYRAALLAATTWSVGIDGSLELRDDDGALQVRFTPAES